MKSFQMIYNSMNKANYTFNEFFTDETVEAIGVIANICVQTIDFGGKLMICGNGGSHCQALHFAEELTGRFRDDRPPIAALALGGNAGHITCTANDYGFEEIFRREVEALGKPEDTLICLSTSGNSVNVFGAALKAKGQGMAVLGLLGKGGGEIKHICDDFIIAPGQTSDRIQELHLLVLHILVECIESMLESNETYADMPIARNHIANISQVA